MRWTLGAFALALMLSACAATPDQSAERRPARSEVKLYALNCGNLRVEDAYFFSDDDAYRGVARDLIVPCYLIRHPQGDLIWDLGLPEGLADIPGGQDAPGMHASMARKLTAQLADLGLTPADIEFISVSHSHFDHIGNGNLFADHSTWIVDPDERAYAFRPEARADQQFLSYAALENAPIRPIDSDNYDVFGDETVVIMQAPGHTPGHTMLMVRLANAGWVLITGDLYHLAETRAHRRVPILNTDRAATLASMDRVEALAASHNARVIREHVPEDFAALPAFPAYLD